MCGIAGFVSIGVQSSDREAAVRNMTERLVHRGPDDDGFHNDANVSFGMRRLSVIDPQHGAQPIRNEDGSVVAVYNGEIYNFQELRKQLEQRGHRFASRTDGEVIVHLWEEFGDGAFEKLNGMFAVAVHDRGKGRVVLARDPLGIKPLFWFADSKGVRFASEIGAILADPTVPRQPDIPALTDYLTHWYVPTPATGFAGIRKLEPGHTLTITDDDQEDALASPAIRVAEEPNANMTLEEAGEIAQIAIDDAVRRQLVADVPVGVFLSGGLDSAIVATLAGRHAGRRLSAFTVGFGQASYDETAPAATVAQAAGLEHHVLQLPDDPSDLVRETLDGFDEPFGDFSSVPMTWLCRQARKDVTVALSGDGGDEAFAGYPHYLMPGVARTFRRLPGFMRGAIAAVVNRWPASFERLSRDYMAKRFVRGAVYPPLQAHLMVKAIFFGEQRRHLFGPRLIEQLERDPMAGLGPQLGQSEGTAGTLVRKLLELDRRTFLLDDNLVKVDRTSMQASLEVRVPLLDRVVLNAADSIPTRLHAGGRRTKVVLREVARRLLPEEISGLQKKGFTPPMPAWLNGPLVPVLDEVLSESAVNAAGLVRFEAVNDLRKQHRDRTRECSRELWTLLSLHHWWARQGF